jgi:LysM repeat protein
VERSDAPEAKVTGKTYTVKSGDRLVFIAKRFSVSQEELIALNKIKDPTKLQIGQTLKIPSKK